MDFSILIRYLIEINNRLRTLYNIAVRVAEDFMRPKQFLIVISFFLFCNPSQLHKTFLEQPAPKLDTRRSAGPYVIISGLGMVVLTSGLIPRKSCLL